MASATTKIDVESQKPTHISHNKHFQQAAALLTIWSILVINEGAIRLINTNPAAGLSGGRPPLSLVFLGGLFEVAFGLLGTFLGVAALVLEAYNTTVTKISMIIQTVFGYFVFIVFVFLVPAFKASEIDAPSLPGLSISQSRFLLALGVLTSFHFCLALQGGQFVFMARLVAAATGRDFLKQKSGNRMRAVFWNANILLPGLWTLITGVLINTNVGSGKLDDVFESPPNVGRLPGLTIVTGLMMIVWGAVGIGMAFAKRVVPLFYFVVSGLVYLVAFLNYTIVQFGLLEKPAPGPVALHAGLVFMTTFLGPYFVHLTAKEQHEGVEEDF